MARQVVLFGDSLTHRGAAEAGGWAQLLGGVYAGKADVIARGMSGANSRDALQRAPEVLLGAAREHAQIVMVWLGANDAVLSASGSAKFVPVYEYGANLVAIVAKARELFPNAAVVLASPPPVHEPARLEFQRAKHGERATGRLERTNANTALYAAECRRVAAAVGAMSLDLFGAFEAHEQALSELLCDGLHLSEQGHRLVFEQVLQLVQERLPEMAPSALSEVAAASTECLAAEAPAEAAAAHAPASDSESTLLSNGLVWDWQETCFVPRAVVIEGGKVRAVVPQEEAPACTHTHDLGGAYVLPGLADAHIHVHHMGQQQTAVDLSGCDNIEQFKAKLRAYAEANPEKDWILGGGWDHEKMKHMPTRFDLDEALPAGKKAFLWRVCFHIAVASTAALEYSNVPLLNPPPMEGGKVDADDQGVTTGVLREGATDLVQGHIQEPNVDVLRKYLLDGLNECLRAGLTSVQTNDINMLKVYKLLDADGLLPIRVHMTAAHDELDEPYFAPSGMLSCDRIKLFTDGALGANTAAIRDGGGKHHGILMHSQEELNALVASAKARGLRVEAHAIGDAAAESALNAFDAAGMTREERPVLTHCQVLGADLIDRLAAKGVVANVQPTFVPTDAAWVKARLAPEKLPFSYAWLTLIKRGIQVVGSSDCPVETCAPLRGMFDAVFRPSSHVTEPPADDSGVFHPQERLSFVEALQLYTQGAQFACMKEKVRGRVEPGYDADLTVLDRDVAADPAQLTKAHVRRVYVGGELRFEGDSCDVPVARNNGPYAMGKGGDPLLRCRCPHYHR